MSKEQAKTRVEGGILEVIVDRPKANAIDRATSTAMGEIFTGFRDDPKLRVAVISGGGEKFSRGSCRQDALQEGPHSAGDLPEKARLEGL